METTTLVLWGDSDQIVDPDYGRVYAAALPRSRFQLLEETGHLPQIETPEQVFEPSGNMPAPTLPAHAPESHSD
jgi:pimeloyl-ACP methyl ester carboxylesterase